MLRPAILTFGLLLAACYGRANYDPVTWSVYNEPGDQALRLQLKQIKHRGDEVHVKLDLTNLYAEPVTLDAAAIRVVFNGIAGRLIDPDATELIGGETRSYKLQFNYEKVLPPEGAVEVSVHAKAPDGSELPQATLLVTVTTLAGQQERT
jgi:hypothetical protein